MAYQPKELKIDINSDHDQEQIRTRKIFDVLKEKAIAREYLSEHEKEFFSMGVKHSIFDDGSWEDYECCDNPKFKFLYLVYAKDLFGFKKIKYYKPVRIFQYQLKAKEIKSDLFYLKFKMWEWETVVNKTNHQEELLQQSSKEAREEIKELKKVRKYANNTQGYNSVEFLVKKKSIILHSKWIYCMALEIFESLDPADFISEINGIEIHFNEYSLIHILNRHYAQVLKQFDTKKSFHSQIFKPRILSSQIKKILSIIDISNILNGKSIDKISFRMDGIDYIIYTSEKIRGNTTYRRLNTFFPVEDLTESNKLEAENTLQIINNNLAVFVPN